MRKLFFALITLVILGLAGALFAVDTIARKAIEEGGTLALGLDTHLESADISLFAGRFQLNGLEVRNPPGFTRENFMSLEVGTVELSLDTVLSEHMDASLFELSGLTIAIEHDGTNTNYEDVLERAKGLESSSSSEQTISVDRIVVRDTEVIFALGLAGISADTTVSVPLLELDDLSSQQFTREELMLFIVQAVIEAALSDEDMLSSNILGELTHQLSDVINIEFDAGIDSLGESLLGDDAESVGGLLKNVLGGD